MKQFGKIFKKVRESRGFRLKDVSKAGISTSQLSRFEKGETDITLSKFMMILDEINMPIDEFMYAIHDFHRDELNELLEQVRHYVTTRDVIGMKRLLATQDANDGRREIFHNLNTIMIKIRLQDLSGENYYTDSDLAYLTDYLFSVEYWGYYELLIFSNTMDVLTHKTFMVLAREMSRRSDFYKEIPNNRRLISAMLLNAYITCIERQELMDAMYFEKQLKQCFFIETEIYERLIFQYAQYLYQYYKNGTLVAIDEMKRCISAIKLAGSDHLAQIYENHLEKLLRDNT